MKCKNCGREIYQNEERVWCHKGSRSFTPWWCPGPGTLAEPEVKEPPE